MFKDKLEALKAKFKKSSSEDEVSEEFEEQDEETDEVESERKTLFPGFTKLLSKFKKNKSNDIQDDDEIEIDNDDLEIENKSSLLSKLGIDKFINKFKKSKSVVDKKNNGDATAITDLSDVGERTENHEHDPDSLSLESDVKDDMVLAQSGRASSDKLKTSVGDSTEVNEFDDDDDDDIEYEAPRRFSLSFSGLDKKTLFIRLGLLLAVIYFAVDHFILQPQVEQEVIDSAPIAMPAKKPKKIKNQQQTQDDNQAVAQTDNTANQESVDISDISAELTGKKTEQDLEKGMLKDELTADGTSEGAIELSDLPEQTDQMPSSDQSATSDSDQTTNVDEEVKSEADLASSDTPEAAQTQVSSEASESIEQTETSSIESSESVENTENLADSSTSENINPDISSITSNDVQEATENQVSPNSEDTASSTSEVVEELPVLELSEIEKTNAQKVYEQMEDKFALEIMKSIEKDHTEGIPKEKLGHQPPPNYEMTGRGLVYNCQGGHWACLDKDNFYQCQKNKFYKYQSDMNADCVDVQVYASEKDCSIAQQMRINQAIDVDFCKVKRAPSSKD